MKTNKVISITGNLFKKFLNIRLILPLAGVVVILIFLSNNLERKTSQNDAIFLSNDSLRVALSVEETKEQAERLSSIFMKNKFSKEDDLIQMKQICEKQIYFLETAASALSMNCEDKDILEKYRKEIKLLISKNHDLIDDLEKNVDKKKSDRLHLITVQTDEVISFLENEKRKFDRIMKMYKLFN